METSPGYIHQPAHRFQLTRLSVRSLGFCLTLILLSACSSTPSPTTASDSSIPTYNANSWRELIASDCKAFFDGCNQCRRSPGSEVAACTRRACAQYSKPYCLDSQPPENPY